MVVLRWQQLTTPRDVMTDDLQENCMSKTRMSCHFIIHNAQCLHLKLTDFFSLIGALRHCVVSRLTRCCAHRSALPLLFSSNALFHFHWVAPSFFTCTTELARQSFALAHFPLVYLLIAAWLFTTTSLPLSPPLLFFSSTTTFTSCHCTASRH